MEIIESTAILMMGRGFNENGWRDFPYQLVVQKSELGDPLYYKLLEGNILRRITTKNIILDVSKFWRSCPATIKRGMTADNAAAAVHSFSAIASSFDEPISPVMFKTEIGYCFHRLDFDAAGGSTPAFDEMMGRTTNAQAMMAWIGSLFDHGSEKQQYLWIYGEGMNGKSSLANFLHEIFNGAATSTQPPNKYGDKFWASQFIGKRLVIFPDCDDFTFINSGMFKSLTGDDVVRIEEKGIGAYSTRLQAKFLSLSNAKPSVDGEASAVRRAIYCEMGPIKNKRMSALAYQRLLRQEAPAFLHKCMEMYKLLAPDGGSIETDAGITAELVRAAEERWAYVANRHLTLYPADSALTKKYKDMPFVMPHYMREIQKQEKLSARDYQSFLNYLNRNHGIFCRGVKTDSGTRYVYLNCDTRGGTNETDKVPEHFMIRDEPEKLPTSCDAGGGEEVFNNFTWLVKK